MITFIQLKQNQLDQLYDWVDSLPLSRAKKNINRDFSDAVMFAETIHHYYPKQIQMHNYPASNSVKNKLSNWKTLNAKVLGKFGIFLHDQDCIRLANSTPMSIEPVLYELKKVLNDSIFQYQFNSNNINKQSSNLNFRNEENTLSGINNNNSPIKNKQSSKLQQLKQIYSLIKEKISIVEKSLQRKDGQIRELEEIIKGQVQ